MGRKRFLAGILTACILLSLLPFSAAAEEESLEQQLIDSCTYGQAIDISRHGVTDDELESLFQRLIHEGKLPWYIFGTYTYHYDTITDYITEFKPELLSREKYDRMRYEQGVAEILDACVQEGMAQWQIALAIHDYLIVHCVYDESLKLDTGYDLLVGGSTVCSGYAALYQDLLLRAGIPCVQVESDPMNHIWNLVQLDGQWYHVDVTWDDPTPDTKGYARHEYFLRTDAQMSAGDEPHHGWETDIVCTDTRYSDAFWTNVESPILFSDPNTCYFIRAKDFENSIYRRDIASGAEKRLYKETETSINIGKGNYIYSHTGLSLWNGKLWFCTMSKVYSIGLDGKNLRQEYVYPARSEGRFLAGCYVANDTVELTACDHDGNPKDVTHPLEASGVHLHSYTPTVTAPTCTEPGYTVSVCQCGITAKGDVTAPTGHDLQQTAYKDATLFSDGFTESVCQTCGLTDSAVLPQIDFRDWVSDNGETVWSAVAVVIFLLFRLGRKKKDKTVSNT
jgi:hypothetical protein